MQPGEYVCIRCRVGRAELPGVRSPGEREILRLGGRTGRSQDEKAFVSSSRKGGNTCCLACIPDWGAQSSKCPMALWAP